MGKDPDPSIEADHDQSDDGISEEESNTKRESENEEITLPKGEAAYLLTSHINKIGEISDKLERHGKAPAGSDSEGILSPEEFRELMRELDRSEAKLTEIDPDFSSFGSDYVDGDLRDVLNAASKTAEKLERPDASFMIPVDDSLESAAGDDPKKEVANHQETAKVATEEAEACPKEPAPNLRWPLRQQQRIEGYTAPLYEMLKSAHSAGLPRPTATEILKAWKAEPPPGYGIEVADNLRKMTYHGSGDQPVKTANVKAVNKVIARLTKSE